MLKKIWNSLLYRLKLYRLPLLSGLLVGTSYIPFYPWAVFFCYIPLWYFWIQNPSPKTVFWSGWISQFTLTLIGFHWVAHTVHEFGHLPWVISIPVLLIYCSFASLHIPLSGWLWSKWNQRFGSMEPKRNLGEKALLIALFMIVVERLFPMIFKWHLGYTWLWAKWPAFQWADVIGFFGLSSIGLLANAVLLFVFLKGQRRQLPIAMGAFAIFFGLMNWTGSLRKNKWSKFDREKKFLTVQANIGNIMKHLAQLGQANAVKMISERHFTLTSEALKEFENPDFIFWAETAYPEYLDKNFAYKKYHRKLRSFALENDVNIITGAYSADPKNRKIYNGIFYLNKNGKFHEDIYKKTHLLAFGEYFPGAQYFPFLKKLVPAISDFGRGDGPKVTDFAGVKIGAQICYEGLYPDFSRKLSSLGTEIMINVTNDSWFGQTFEPHQHLYMTLARAVEVRRPLIRSTNTGISTAILANGEVLEKSPLHEEWHGLFNLKYRSAPDPTFFAKYGFLFDYLAVFSLFVFLGFSLLKSKGSKSQLDPPLQ